MRHKTLVLSALCLATLIGGQGLSPNASAESSDPFLQRVPVRMMVYSVKNAFELHQGEAVVVNALTPIYLSEDILEDGLEQDVELIANPGGSIPPGEPWMFDVKGVGQFTFLLEPRPLPLVRLSVTIDGLEYPPVALTMLHRDGQALVLLGQSETLAYAVVVTFPVPK